jgi:hypothetical protein
VIIGRHYTIRLDPRFRNILPRSIHIHDHCLRDPIGICHTGGMTSSTRPPQTLGDDEQDVRRCRRDRLCQSPAPDGRWQLALEIIRSGSHARLSQHGPQLVRLVRYLRAVRATSSDGDLQALRGTDPTIVKSVALHETNRLRRLELQCRFLARQSSAEIAYELGTTPAAIELYGDLFYDVRSQLDTMSLHLIQHVIGMSVTGPSPSEAYARLMAYQNGPGTIPAWIDYLPHRNEEHDLTAWKGRQREAISQYLTAEGIRHTECPDDRLTRYLGEIQYHFSRPQPPRSVDTIIRSLMFQMLQGQSATLSEDEDVVPIDFALPEWLDSLAGCA